jgi:tetratricopeptide (TPR) repeat protein
LLGLADIALRRRRPRQATKHYQRSLELATALGDRTAQVYSLLGLADVARTRRNFDQAAEHYRRSLELSTTHGDRNSEGYSLLGLGRVAVARGELSRAQADFERAATIFRQLQQTSGERQAQELLDQLRAHTPSETAQASTK